MLSRTVESLLETTAHGPWDKSSLSFRECLPLDILTIAIDQIIPLAQAKSQQVEIKESVTLPPLMGDEIRLVRVLVNLLANAVKFTPTGGSISAAAQLRDDGKAIVFSVADNGIGIAEANLARIFQKGVSIAESDVASTGLGLFVCKELVEAHGGEISVVSKKDVGSTFTFTIPVNPGLSSEAVDGVERSNSRMND